MKDNINIIFDDFLSKQTIQAPADFYENLMEKINSQDEIVENNLDSFFNKKISTNIDFCSKIITSKRKSYFTKLLKYAACFGICLIGTAVYFYSNLNTNHTNKSNDIGLYAEAMFFSDETLADISEVSSQNALDMLNYFASTTL